MKANCETCDETTKMYMILEGLLFENPIVRGINRLVNGFENLVNSSKKRVRSFISNDINKIIIATVGYMAFSVFIMLTAYALIVY